MTEDILYFGRSHVSHERAATLHHNTLLISIHSNPGLQTKKKTKDEPFSSQARTSLSILAQFFSSQVFQGYRFELLDVLLFGLSDLISTKDPQKRTPSCFDCCHIVFVDRRHLLSDLLSEVIEKTQEMMLL